MTILPFDNSSFVWGAAGMVAGTGITPAEKAAMLSDINDLKNLTPPSVLGDLANVSNAAPSTGQLLRWNGSMWAPFTLNNPTFRVSIQFIIDGGGATITTGIKGDLRIPFDFTPTEWSLFANQSGAIQIGLWANSYSNFPPTNVNSITGSAPVAIPATNNKWASATLTGWTIPIPQNHILRFNVDSVTSIQRVTVVLYGNRTITL